MPPPAAGAGGPPQLPPPRLCLPVEWVGRLGCAPAAGLDRLVIMMDIDKGPHVAGYTGIRVVQNTRVVERRL